MPVPVIRSHGAEARGDLAALGPGHACGTRAGNTFEMQARSSQPLFRPHAERGAQGGPRQPAAEHDEVVEVGGEVMAGGKTVSSI